MIASGVRHRRNLQSGPNGKRLSISFIDKKTNLFNDAADSQRTVE